MRITDDMITIRVNAINERLHGEYIRIRKERTVNTWYVVEEMYNGNNGAMLFTGNKHDTFLFVAGMFNGLCQVERTGLDLNLLLMED